MRIRSVCLHPVNCLYNLNEGLEESSKLFTCLLDALEWWRSSMFLSSCFVFVLAEEGNAMAAIADKPSDVANFGKHCDQRRKYPVLLRVEFQVNFNFLFCFCVVQI